MSKERFEFKKHYSEIREKFPEIIELKEGVIENIQAQIDTEEKQEKTSTYAMSIIGASLTIILFPFLIVKIFNSFEAVPQLIENIINLITKESKNVYNFSFCFGSIAILMYLFLLPSTIFSGKSNSANNPFSINRKQGSFVFITILGVYISIGLIGFIILINWDEANTVVVQILKYYLFIPVSIISFILLMFLIVVVLILPFRKSFEKKFSYCSNTRIEISIILLKTQEKLKPYDDGDFIPQKTISSLSDKLDDIRLLIKKFPFTILGNVNNREIIEDFDKASHEFEKLIVQFIKNQESELASFKQQIIKYLNIFIVGDLSRLPKAETITVSEKKKTVKIYHFILLGLYLTLPILIVIILNQSFNLTFDDYTQSLLRILYIIWAFVGIFSNPFTFNNENKELLKDLIKTLIGKG